MAGIQELVHRSEDPDGPFMTITEVAEYFERDKDTIRRWGKKCGVPTRQMPLGDGDSGAFVWLYTRSDLEKLTAHSAGINPKGGRPKSDATK
jgi:hypothetical protein